MNSIFSYKNYPIFQNIVYDTIEKAKSCKTMDIEIIQDKKQVLYIIISLILQ